MKKNGKLILATAVVIVLIAVFVGIWYATRPATSQGSKTITVEVVHKDGSSKDFTYHTDAQYLGEVLLAEGLIQGDEGDYGLYITAVDGDRFDATNLNRQLLSRADNLGRSKVRAAAERAAAVNPGVSFRGIEGFLDKDNCRDIVAGHDLVMDALDSGEARLVLAEGCAAEGPGVGEQRGARGAAGGGRRIGPWSP